MIVMLCFGSSFIDYGENMCAFISYAIGLYLGFDLCRRGKLHLLGQYNTYTNKVNLTSGDAERYGYWNDWGDIDAVESTATETIPTSHRRYLPSTTTPTEVEKISSAMKTTATAIEFCGEAEIKYKSVEKKKEVIKPQLPTASKLQQQKAENAPKEAVKDLIMIVNESDIKPNRKCLYEAILELFKDSGYKGIKLQAALQSLSHIDITFKNVVYYLDTAVLTNAKIGFDETMLNKIVETTKLALKRKDIEVEFTEKKNITILNYFLSK